MTKEAIDCILVAFRFYIRVWIIQDYLLLWNRA